MKKWVSVLCVFLGVLLMVKGASAFYITDPPNDAIGTGFETYGINVVNFTPGQYTGNIIFEIGTDYPQAGLTVGSWETKPADLFIWETYYGQTYLWAIPTIAHDGFQPGYIYAVKSFYISDDFEPAGGGYIYNHNIPVWIKEMGNNYGYGYFPGGPVTWDLTGSTNPLYKVTVVTGIWEDDPNAKFRVLWATATCANDVVSTVPLPGAVLLLGAGLVRLAAYARRRQD